MVLTEEQLKAFKSASVAMMKYLGENHHPYVKVIIENGSAEILESSARVVSEDFIPD